jgi:hypothetical protein
MQTAATNHMTGTQCAHQGEETHRHEMPRPGFVSSKLVHGRYVMEVDRVPLCSAALVNASNTYDPGTMGRASSRGRS